MPTARRPTRPPPAPPIADPRAAVAGWFAVRGWSPFPFQHDAWDAYLAGRDGLVHAATGTGKTLAAWLGPVLEYLAEHPDPATWNPKAPPPLRVLWVTPLRALAADTLAALETPVRGLGLPWLIQTRTGDTKASVKARQRDRLPTALVTTPESLCLLLTRPDAAERFADLRCVVVDEWHELLSGKRGVLVELALARLRTWRPALRTWGLSATLGNTPQALDVLTGGFVGRVELRGPPSSHGRRAGLEDSTRPYARCVGREHPSPDGGARRLDPPYAGAHPRPRPQGHPHRHRAAAEGRAVPVGRPPRAATAPAGGRRRRGGPHRPRVH